MEVHRPSTQEKERDILKTKLVFLSALAAPMVFAQAPSGVTLYGVVDSGVEYITNVGPAGDGLARVPSNTASSPSRWGLRGSEDLGGGLRANFVLESGFGADTGTLGQGGRMFGRQAHVGLSGSWGSVAVGHQYTMLFWSILDADVLGPNVFGIGSLDAYFPNARSSNAISYRGTFSGMTLGAHYSLGRDPVNAGPSPAGTNCAGESAADSSACRAWSLMVKYDAPTWGVAAVVDRQNGGPGAFGGLTSSQLRDTRSMVNGYYKLNNLKLGAGLMRRDNEGNAAAPKSDLLFIGATYNVTPAFALDGEYFRLDFKNSANQANLLVLRGTYSFSKRTAVYASLGRISNDGTLAASVSGGAPGSAPVAGGGQSGLMLGVRHNF
jgi:predicted porin